MLGRRIFTTSAVLLCAAISLAAEPDYFPLQVGNSWVYRSEGRLPDVQVVEVRGATTVNGQLYHELRFFGQTALVRLSDDGTLYAYSGNFAAERVWFRFGAPVGESYATGVDTCTRSARVASKEAAYQGPYGEFSNALRIDYTPACADAGINSQVYLPYIGLVQHSVGNIAGERRYDLIYSRTGLTEIAESEVSFQMALDSAAPTARLIARMTLRNSGPLPITLTFPSGQKFDFVLRNERGEVAYIWSADKFFTQAVETETVSGERNYVVSVPLGSGNLTPGQYTAEGYLTTIGPRRQYFASVPLEIRPVPNQP